MKTVRFGVIGAGLMGRLHGENLASRVTGAELVAICDISSTARTAVSALLPGEAIYEDYRRMLELTQIDAVAICTPPDSHAEIVEAAAQAGKHVFCEKPLASDVNRA